MLIGSMHQELNTPEVVPNLVANRDQLNVYQDREGFPSNSITKSVIMTGCKDLWHLFQFLLETYKPILAFKAVQLHILR
jgi:hypothetical protein